MPVTAVDGQGHRDLVVDRIREVAPDPGLIASITLRLHVGIDRKRKDLETERRQLPELIARLSSEGSRLTRQLCSGWTERRDKPAERNG